MPDSGHCPIKKKRAVPSENAFRCTSALAEAKGMKVNTIETNVLAITNDALSYRPVAFIEDMEGNLLESKPGEKLKVLGFTFGDRPTVCKHVETIIQKFRQRFWTVYNLK